jgi:hypothetical protein
MKTTELRNFILWYWENIDSNPCGLSATGVAEDYLNELKEDKKNRRLGILTNPPEEEKLSINLFT